MWLMTELKYLIVEGEPPFVFEGLRDFIPNLRGITRDEWRNIDVSILYWLFSSILLMTLDCTNITPGVNYSTLLDRSRL